MRLYALPSSVFLFFFCVAYTIESPQEKCSQKGLDFTLLSDVHSPFLDAYEKEEASRMYRSEKSELQEKIVNQNAQTIVPTTPMPGWVIEASLKNAPLLIKGICAYLKRASSNASIRSFHRFILVGMPGAGKTTLAQAIAHTAGYPTVYVPATFLLGQFRNETAVKIRNFFVGACADGLKKIIIIDEIHKLFEHYKNEQSDSSQTAAAFWLSLDEIEKYNPQIIVIGTANGAELLPPELKSRFHGKIITIPLPSKQQRLKALQSIVAHDPLLIWDEPIDLTALSGRLSGWSLRDIQLLFDTAKIFAYTVVSNDQPIKLSHSHLEKALRKLNKETEDLKESRIERWKQTIATWDVFLSAAVHVGMFSKMLFDARKLLTNE